MDSEQTQPDWSVAVAAWWEVNQKKVYAGVGAALLIAFAWYSWSYHKANVQLDASGALLALNRPAEGGVRPPTPPASEYLKVAEQYSGTPAADRAELLAAGSLFAEKKFPEAKQKFSAFLAAHPDGPLAEIAEFGVASCLNAANDDEKAIAAYKQFISSHGGSPMANEARLELGVIYESKKQPDEALKLYDQVLKDRDQSIWARGAMMRQEQVYEKYPNLAPKPVAVSVPTNAPTPVISKVPAAKQPAPATNSTPSKK